MQNTPAICFFLLIGTALLLVVPAIAAGEKVVLYQTDFSSDPRWTTNSPSHYYWDVPREMYHFETEGGTNGYSFIPVDYTMGPFTLEYDLIVSSLEKGGAFRFGMTSTDMDISKGVNVLSIFEELQGNQIMAIAVIDPNNHLHEKTSQLQSYCGGLPKCETKQFAENTTYHVLIHYNDELTQADVKVTDKSTGELVWGYFVPIGRELYSLNRLAITTKGDYQIGNNAEGYIDNVILVTYRPIVPTTIVTTVRTTPPATIPPTTLPTPTESPLSFTAILCALGAGFGLIVGRRSKR
jgi:hypothetical protein